MSYVVQPKTVCVKIMSETAQEYNALVYSQTDDCENVKRWDFVTISKNTPLSVNPYDPSGESRTHWILESQLSSVTPSNYYIVNCWGKPEKNNGQYFGKVIHCGSKTDTYKPYDLVDFSSYEESIPNYMGYYFVKESNIISLHSEKETSFSVRHA
jgi:hypothetical protein